MGEITKACVEEHLIVVIKTAREHGDPAFEVPVHCNPGCACVPPISVVVLKRTSMTSALYKATRLIRYWIVRRIGKRTQRVITHVSSICIHIIFCARRSILQIIFLLIPKKNRYRRCWRNLRLKSCKKNIPPGVPEKKSGSGRRMSAQT